MKIPYALQQARLFHPRAMKLIEKLKPFVVVAIDEPYFKQVYDLIRENEKQKGTWTAEDESLYEDSILDWTARMIP